MKPVRDQIRTARFAALVGLLLVFYAVSVAMQNYTFGVFLLLFSVLGLPVVLAIKAEHWFGNDQTVYTVQVSGIAWAAHALATVIIAATGQESVICLVMAIPIHIIVVPLTIWIMRKGGKRVDPNVFRVAGFGLPIILIALDVLPLAPARTYLVETEIDIAADTGIVWAQVYEIGTIAEDERPWTVSHDILGLPKPVSANVTGNTRSATWTRGVEFEEQIKKQVPHQSVEWTFRFPDPMTLAAIDTRIRPGEGLVDLQGGGYRIERIGDKSRLILRTEYQLTSYFQRYLSAWGEFFLQDIHWAVLHVVKTRAEAMAVSLQESVT